MRLGVRVDVGELEDVAPGDNVGVGVSVMVGVPVGVAEGVGVPVELGVGVEEDVGVGVPVAEGLGTTMLPGLPSNFSCIAQPSPALFTVNGVDPHGPPVGPAYPIKA